MTKKSAFFFILLLLVGSGCMRKDIIKSMAEKPNANWMMIGADLRPGDSSEYCLSEFRKRGGKTRDKYNGQCRKWTVIDRDENTVTLQLDMLNAPSTISDIRRTYVVGNDGFIREARAVSTKSGDEGIIRIAEKGEEFSLDRLVPLDLFTAEDLKVIGAYSRREGGRTYVTDEAYGQMEVVPVKAVFTPTEDRQRIEFYLKSNIAEFGYIIQINVMKNLKKSKKDVLWVNQLQNKAGNVTAPLP
jgi:hypothetical protein